MIGKPDRSGEMFKLTIGLYNCVCSDKSFRSVIGKEKITLRGVLEKNNSLEEQLMEATNKKTELECIVKTLEEEKAQLFAEVEALRAIPVLEEKVSTLESDIARLREEKGTLINRLTELATDVAPIIQPEPVEKPLEAYISEATNIQAPAPIEESICECNEAKTDETMTESPVIDAIATEVSAPVDLPVETSIEEKPIDVSPVEVAPVPVILEEAPATIQALTQTPLSDTLTIEKINETPAETVATDIQSVKVSPKDEVPTIMEASPVEAASIDNQQVEIPAIENLIVNEVVETPLRESVQVDVSSSQPQVVAPVIEEKTFDTPVIESHVEVPIEVKPETIPTNTASVDIVAEIPNKIEEVPSEPLVAEPLIEVKSVEVVPTETVSVESPPLIEENSVEIPSPVITPINEPLIGETTIEDTLAKPATDVVASVDMLDEVISEMAKEIEVEMPVEEAVSESTPPSISEPVQITPIEAAKPESLAQEPEESVVTQVIEPTLMEAPKVEASVVETVIAENPKVEELIAETPAVEDQAHVVDLEEIVADVNAGEVSKPSEEKQTVLIVA
jgi:hypothetical protein